MGYIRFNITRVTDNDGRATQTNIKRMESDISNALESERIWNAMTFVGAIKKWLRMDEGLLDRDMLGDSDWFTLDRDMLNVDKLI